MKVDDLDAKWTTSSPDEPPCASCGVKIAGVDELDQPNVPVRLWKKINGVQHELALCLACYSRRITP